MSKNPHDLSLSVPFDEDPHRPTSSPPRPHEALGPVRAGSGSGSATPDLSPPAAAETPHRAASLPSEKDSGVTLQARESSLASLHTSPVKMAQPLPVTVVKVDGVAAGSSSPVTLPFPHLVDMNNANIDVEKDEVQELSTFSPVPQELQRLEPLQPNLNSQLLSTPSQDRSPTEPPSSSPPAPGVMSTTMRMDFDKAPPLWLQPGKSPTTPGKNPSVLVSILASAHNLEMIGTSLENAQFSSQANNGSAGMHGRSQSLAVTEQEKRPKTNSYAARRAARMGGQTPLNSSFASISAQNSVSNLVSSSVPVVPSLRGLGGVFGGSGGASAEAEPARLMSSTRSLRSSRYSTRFHHGGSLMQMFPDFPESLYLSRDRFKIHREKDQCLGKGAFGKVVQGELYPPGVSAPFETPMAESLDPDLPHLGSRLRSARSLRSVRSFSSCNLANTTQLPVHQQPYSVRTASFYNSGGSALGHHGSCGSRSFGATLDLYQDVGPPYGGQDPTEAEELLPAVDPEAKEDEGDEEEGNMPENRRISASTAVGVASPTGAPLSPPRASATKTTKSARTTTYRNTFEEQRCESPSILCISARNSPLQTGLTGPHAADGHSHNRPLDEEEHEEADGDGSSQLMGSWPELNKYSDDSIATRSQHLEQVVTRLPSRQTGLGTGLSPDMATAVPGKRCSTELEARPDPAMGVARLALSGGLYGQHLRSEDDEVMGQRGSDFVRISDANFLSRTSSGTEDHSDDRRLHQGHHRPNGGSEEQQQQPVTVTVEKEDVLQVTASEIGEEGLHGFHQELVMDDDHNEDMDGQGVDDDGDGDVPFARGRVDSVGAFSYDTSPAAATTVPFSLVSPPLAAVVPAAPRPHRLSLESGFLPLDAIPSSAFIEAVETGSIPFRSVAVKIVCKVDLNKQSFYNAFCNEVLMANQLHHPCLVNIYGVAEDQDDLYFVMDLAENGNLSEYIRKYGIEDTREMAPRFLADVVLALEYLRDGKKHLYSKPLPSYPHASPRPGHVTADPKTLALATAGDGTGTCDSGDLHSEWDVTGGSDDEPAAQLRDSIVLHRDLKPDNILLTWDFHLKLGDFGTGCFLGDAAANNFGGSPSYIAPEMVKENKAGPYSDLWSLGCVLYELFEGHPPFQAATPYLIILQVKQFQVGSLVFSEGVREEARDLVRQLLQPVPEDRLGSDERGGFEALKQHPFFAAVDWSCQLDVTNITAHNTDYTKELTDYLKVEEKVVYCSPVTVLQCPPTDVFDKEAEGLMVLVLTDAPRLFVVDPELPGPALVVPWKPHMRVRVNSAAKFQVLTGPDTYVFNDQNHRADLWGLKVNETIEKTKKIKKAKRMGLRVTASTPTVPSPQSNTPTTSPAPPSFHLALGSLNGVHSRHGSFHGSFHSSSNLLNRLRSTPRSGRQALVADTDAAVRHSLPLSPNVTWHVQQANTGVASTTTTARSGGSMTVTVATSNRERLLSPAHDISHTPRGGNDGSILISPTGHPRTTSSGSQAVVSWGPTNTARSDRTVNSSVLHSSMSGDCGDSTSPPVEETAAETQFTRVPPPPPPSRTHFLQAKPPPPSIKRPPPPPVHPSSLGRRGNSNSSTSHHNGRRLSIESDEMVEEDDHHMTTNNNNNSSSASGSGSGGKRTSRHKRGKKLEKKKQKPKTAAQSSAPDE